LETLHQRDTAEIAHNTGHNIVSDFVCVYARFDRLGHGLAAQAHVLASVAPLEPAPQSLGVASGVGGPLSACSHVPDRGAQAGAQTVSCGDATLSQQEKNTRQINTEF
jgi:hypothetical protein